MHKLFCEIKKTVTETCKFIHMAYGEGAWWGANIFEQHKRYSEEKGGVEDYEWYDCPLRVKTDENVEKVRATVKTYCQLDMNTITE